MKAEQITGPVAYHGEGPVWSAAWGGLRWLDMLAGDVLSLAEDGTVARRHVADLVAAVRPRRRGGAVIGVERGFALEDADGTVTALDPLWGDAGVRMNEGGCDPDGRFYCGSMAYDQREGAGAVHRLDPDGSVTTVVGGVTISNGLEWSPDGTRAYYADTATGRVDVFDYDRESGLTGRRPFAAALGSPDGLTVDAEGGVWVALYDGGSVRRYAPDRTLDHVVEVPVAKTTACTFGGDGLDRLFITTSREHLDPGEEPDAGALFTCTPGVRGVPAREFAG
ncbi:SMP-30/gluconolactonase/LRE family protein [Actinomadura sp. KC345]|uniref:SMP-30/gluconolactonase/LRE family protein n=1 Tax=Actinomadura sp. KC345 TaxID=2530371 RepID=UPI001048E397|nr:SMP-30/gluconolactonase/LRE family protein [Actinomadura sp. KC345]TDC47075.1 SMP-30/gluconolactonase/LRE family protein [Actinomadura sp. KC345]